jgi:hypothetical protein
MMHNSARVMDGQRAQNTAGSDPAIRQPDD